MTTNNFAGWSITSTAAAFLILGVASPNSKAQQPIRPPQQVQPQQPAQPQAPWVITAAEQARIDQILNFWEFSTGRINTFQCDFMRWDYNDAFAPDAETALSISEGLIRYAAPDKGLIETRSIVFLARGPNGAQQIGPDGRQQYEPREGELGDHWVCTGNSVYEYQQRQQCLHQTILPEAMRGRAISDGPLPFLFGVSRDRLQARYWIRELQPPDGTHGEFWLQIQPKYRGDAANFVQAEIILDETDFLPKAIKLHLPGGRERKVFQFSDRTTNSIVARFQDDFLRNFVRPRLPNGWRESVDDLRGPAPSGQAQFPASPRG